MAIWDQGAEKHGPHTFADALLSIERMLRHTDVTVSAGLQPSYNTFRQTVVTRTSQQEGGEIRKAHVCTGQYSTRGVRDEDTVHRKSTIKKLHQVHGSPQVRTPPENKRAQANVLCPLV